MPSSSLSTWASARTERVARLRAAHQALGGTGPGRRGVTDELNQGNADPGTLGSDFGLFGIALWAGLQARFQDRAKDWNHKLAALNMARNGIVHDDAAKVARVQALEYGTSPW